MGIHSLALREEDVSSGKEHYHGTAVFPGRISSKIMAITRKVTNENYL